MEEKGTQGVRFAQSAGTISGTAELHERTRGISVVFLLRPFRDPEIPYGDDDAGSGQAVRILRLETG